MTTRTRAFGARIAAVARGVAILGFAALGLVSFSGASAQEVVLRGFGGATFGSVGIDAAASSPCVGIPQEPICPAVVVEEHGEHDLGTGFVVGGALGMRLDNFTLEGELAYRDGASAIVGQVAREFDVELYSLLANAWYDVPLPGGLIGYAGGGVGAAQGRWSWDGLAWLSRRGDDVETTFAWQLGAGLRYPLSEKTSIGAGYRRFEVPELVEESFSDETGSSSLNVDYAEDSVILEIVHAF
jgi:opacity protein-like surface antigen